jgi:hypothetical protein
MTTADTDELVVAAALATRQAAENASIRPFTFNAPQAELDELRRRIAATRWPEKEPAQIFRRVCRSRRCRS